MLFQGTAVVLPEEMELQEINNVGAGAGVGAGAVASRVAAGKGINPIELT